MEEKEIKRLKYRRQYIFSPVKIECPFQYNEIKLPNGYFLYVHIDLVFTEIRENNILLILLGDIFDYENTEKNNFEILADLVFTNFDELLKKFSNFSGSYVLIYINNEKICFVNDTTATKKIFYCRNQDGVWCASQPHLLAKVTGINKSKDFSKQSYYASSEFEQLNYANIGDTTIYDEISQLLPNHYLNINDFSVFRFWPIRKKEVISLEEGISFSTKLIKGYIESIYKRYKIMLPVTAGKDSRTLLAATYNFRHDVFYYLNKEKRLNNNHNDIKIPTQLFKRLNIDYHMIDPYIPVDKDFKRIYFTNNEYASEFYLPIIYNYYLNYSDRINMPGNIATGGIWFYPTYRKKITTDLLLRLHNVTKYTHARQAYSKWLDNTLEACLQTRYYLVNLFYWEERLGNWGTQIQLDKDIAQLDFNPYNSRLLIEKMLSIKPIHNIEMGNYPLNMGIIKNLWPELAEIPINPNRKNKIYQVFDFLGLKYS